MSETPKWITQQEKAEELLQRMAQETGGHVVHDAVGYPRLAHDSLGNDEGR